MRIVNPVLAALLVAIALSACQEDAPDGAVGTPSAAETPPASSEAPTSAVPSSGSDLVFQADGSIWVQAPGEPRRSAAPGVPTDNQHPDWSRDGEQIAFDTNFNAIWTVGVDGSGESELVSCTGECSAVFEPAWSPDGSTLAFVRILGDGTHTLAAQVLTLDPTSGETTVVHEDTAGDVWEYTPRWSFDGSSLVLERDLFASNLLSEEQILSSELRVVSVATGVARSVRGTRGGQTPDWSPTEDLIVYTDGINLFTVRPDGEAKTKLTAFESSEQSAIQPTFLPDGSGVVFTWVTGTQNSGTESTVPAIVDLASGRVTAIQEANGATHVRVRPSG